MASLEKIFWLLMEGSIPSLREDHGSLLRLFWLNSFPVKLPRLFIILSTESFWFSVKEFLYSPILSLGAKNSLCANSKALQLPARFLTLENLQGTSDPCISQVTTPDYKIQFLQLHSRYLRLPFKYVLRHIYCRTQFVSLPSVNSIYVAQSYVPALFLYKGKVGINDQQARRY